MRRLLLALCFSPNKTRPCPGLPTSPATNGRAPPVTADASPQVRRSLALTVTALALKLGGIMHRGGPPDAETETHILRCKVVPLVQRAAEDPAWQVRDPLDPAWQVIRRSVGSR